MVIEVDPGTVRRERRGGRDDPARLDPAQRQPRRVPRLARRRHPGVPEAAARRRRRGARPEQGRGPEALGGAAPARALRPRRRPDQRRAGAAPREHRQLDPQLPACSATSSGDNDQTWPAFVDSSNAVLESLRQPGGRDPRALRELPGTLQATKGALNGANQLALQSTPALQEARCPGARALSPALRSLQRASSARRSARSATRSGRSPSRFASRSPTCARRRRGSAARCRRLRARLHPPERGPQRPRLQPDGRRRGLPLLPALAEPQREPAVHRAGRPRPAAPRDGPGVLRHGQARPGHLPRASRSCRRLAELTGLPSRKTSRVAADGTARADSRARSRSRSPSPSPASACSSSSGAPSAGRSRSSRRATGSRCPSTRRRSSRSSRMCGSRTSRWAR